tara:strand:- start:12989 stop:13138 length:150 start_codon:yes stop_codon:yes gene_type:complete
MMGGLARRKLFFRRMLLAYFRDTFKCFKKKEKNLCFQILTEATDLLQFS